MIKLRDYQESLANSVRASFSQGHKRVLAVLPCRAGKTWLFAYVAERHLKISEDNYVWFLVHRKELVDQAKAVFENNGLDTSRVLFGMIPTLYRHIHEYRAPTLIIEDECLSGDTIISTSEGDKQIKDVKVGDLVLSFNHENNSLEYKKVKKLFVGSTIQWHNILVGSTIVQCTENHPFYVKGKGYVEAKYIKSGDCVLQLVPKTSESVGNGEGGKVFLQSGREGLLLQGTQGIVSEENKVRKDVGDEQEVCLGTNEEEQLHLEARRGGKTEENIEKNREKTTDKGWQWHRVDTTSSITYGSAERIQPSCGMRDKNVGEKAFDLPAMLQGGCGPSSVKDSDRSGWEHAQFSENSRKRQEERGKTFGTWLDCDSFEEFRDTEQPSGMLKYNIEVDGNNNYFANGILVHNCHHNTRAGKMWTAITDTYPNVPMVGLTATPARLDGAPLGDVFDDMCIGVGSDFLTKRGYLAPYDYYAPKSLNDYSERGNDFDMESVEMSLLKSKIMGDVMKYLDLSRKTIIYCPTLKYSRRLVEQIGPLARHVDGETPDDERKQAMDDFRSGKVRVLSNYALFGEGVDVPDCDCVIMLRPTLSVSLYIQMAMRCLTYFPNKRAVIYDFVGNAYRHGMPTEQRDWSLEGKMKCPNPSGEKEVKIRECSNCLRVYQGQDRICPYCGHDNGKTRREIEQDKKDELERITKIEKRKLRQEQGMAETMEDLIKIAKTRGYKNPRGWAWYVYNSRKK